MPSLMAAPSILPNIRSYSGMPAEPFTRSRLWRFEQPQPERNADGFSPGMYRPLLHTFSPPGCLGEVIRRPMGIIGQMSVDMFVGGVALGCALGMSLVGQTHIAKAFLGEHGFQVVVLLTVVGATAFMGAQLGLAMWLLG